MATELTVVIPTFNCEKKIGICLKSVVSQSYPNFEIVVIDGGSVDATLEIIKTFNDPRILLFSEADRGIYDAMNKGIERSSGEWIYFLGGDDTLVSDTVFENVFAKQSDIVNKSDFIYGNVLWGDKQYIYNGRYDIYELYRQNICHQCIFVRRRIIERIGNFNISYRLFADWDFNIRCFLDKDIRISYLSLIIANYAITGTSSLSRDILFDNNKRKIFFQYLSSQPYHKRLKFRAMFGENEFFLQKVRNLGYVLLYRLTAAGRTLLRG